MTLNRKLTCSYRKTNNHPSLVTAIREINYFTDSPPGSWVSAECASSCTYSHAQLACEIFVGDQPQGFFFVASVEAVTDQGMVLQKCVAHS